MLSCLCALNMHAQDPVKKYGQLQVRGAQLCDQQGHPVILRGVSLGWHNLWPRFYNKKVVQTLKQDWHASVVRAAMMITVYSIVSIANRDRMSLNTLSLTAIIMLVWNPLYLYDVGFQMSFMAVLFILLCYPTLFALMPGRWMDGLPFRPLRWAWSMVVVSLCAQLGTCPLTMYYFGRFSVYFLLTNFIVIPMAILILYLTAAMLLCSWWPAVQSFIAGPLIWVVDVQNSALRGIAALPGSHIEDIELSRWQVVVIYLLISGAMAMMIKGRKMAIVRGNKG